MSGKRATNHVEPLQSDDHVLGPDSAPATVIAYCDFECPYCGQAFVLVKGLRRRLEHHLRFVFRHFPLVDKHPLAQQAAEAAEAAGNQGRFWPMHDLLFENQEDLETDDLYVYADMAGLDVPRFKDDLHGRLYSSRVMRDVKSGRRQGIDTTPTFFLNNVLVSDDDQLEELVLRAA